ncbi:MAG: enoyl-CoA hydratase/isomerase family protein, partial [Rhodospirillales bacterium]|nr:enoyl-CoA hydratase/isomerase family protein [Rhodospirillales bacterium]
MSAQLQLDTERMLARSEDGIGWMTFNNPARHNALSLEMWRGIGDILEAWSTDGEVRVVIMRGAGGKAFVSGADISEFDSRRASAAQRVEYDNIVGRATHWLAPLRKTPPPAVDGE